MPLKPLGLPPGSIRALLLLALAARAILDLRAGHELTSWLVTALLVAAAAYFGHRHGVVRPTAAATLPGGPPPPRAKHPLGLPAGTIRVLFLLALGYGGWLWFRRHDAAEANVPVAWVLGGFVLGVVVRFVLSRVRDADDPSTPGFWHVQALVALAAAGGLVVFGVAPPPNVPDWVEPFLAAVVAYYFGSR